MRGLMKVCLFVFVVTLICSLLTVNVLAALPEGVIQVNKASDGNTRNAAWINTETGIISIPTGTDFDNGNQNHGAYHFYSPVEIEQVYYVHWVIKVQETTEAEGQVILSQDPWYLNSYGPDKGQAEVPSGESATEGLISDSIDFYYDDATPGKWQVLSCGFEVMNEDSKFVQHRLHFKNIAPVQVKYLVVTTEKFETFACDPETGEIDGITNDKPFVAPTEKPTAAPTTAAPTTQAPTTQAPTTQAPTATNAEPNNESEPGGLSTPVIIGIVVVVIALGAGIIYFVSKGKKK